MTGPGPADRLRVLLVESDSGAAAEIRRQLGTGSDVAYTIETAEGLTAASQKLVAGTFDGVLLSLALPESPGVTAVRALRDRAPRTPIIVLVRPDDAAAAVAAMREGAQDYTIRGSLYGSLLARRIRHAGERRRMEEETRLLTTLSLAVAEAKDLDAALNVAMREICGFTGWAMGMAWIPDGAGQRLDAGPAWLRASPRLQAFREESARQPTISGAGLLWAVFHGREPVWCPDLAADPRFRRKEAAARAGLRGVLAVPVLTREQVVAVIEFLIADPRPQDEQLVPFVSAIAAQLGQVFLRKRTEEALRESEERLRQLIEAAYNGYLVHEDGAIREISPGCAAVFGCTPAEMIGRNILDFATPEWRDEVRNKIRSGIEGSYELMAMRKDGTQFRAEVVGHEHHWKGRPARIGAIRDVTSRRRAEERIGRLNECFVSFGPDPTGNIDRLVSFCGEEMGARWAVYAGFEGEAVVARGQWRIPPGLFARNSPPERFCREVFAGAGRNVVISGPAAPIRHGDTTPNVHRFGSDTLVGRVVWCGGVAAGTLCVGFAGDADPGSEEGKFMGILSSAIGVEEERRVAQRQRQDLEEQLRHSMKMEAVGRLAGGVAHDFNNLLTAIIGYSDLLLDRLTKDQDRRELTEVRKAAERAAWLTRQLLAFSRKQVLQPDVLDINLVMTEIEKLMRRMLGENVALEVRPAAEEAFVRADRSQLEQVLMNLAVNAKDAMPRGGRIRIESSVTVLPAPAVASEESPLSGPCVRVVVSDTGVGMDPETLAHLFEPFFTTKGRGQATGLGLATVYGIVRQTGGTISVESTPGAGTTFTLYFPRILTAASLPGAAAPGPTPSGLETILLVEDEDTVRSLAARALRRLGYTVLEARSGEEACEKSEALKSAVHLLLTDVVMPGMTGPETARKLAASRPAMKVMYMSGYTDDQLGEHGVLKSGIAFLHKPFAPDLLARKVREVLDSASA
ncbi:MAG: response regulator [Planctomycetes bacterium]|nr:response regulator [Planctomycetota bacterium]